MKALKLYLTMSVLAVAAGAAGQAPRTGLPPPAIPPGAMPDDEGGRIVGGRPALPGSQHWQAELYSSIPYTAKEIADDRALADDHPNKRYLDIKQEWERV